MKARALNTKALAPLGGASYVSISSSCPQIQHQESQSQQVSLSPFPTHKLFAGLTQSPS